MARKKKQQKERRFSFGYYDQKHVANLASRKQIIDDIYNEVANEAARIGTASGFNDPDRPFYIDDYPAAKKRMDEAISVYVDRMQLNIEEGNKQEWLLSAAKNDAMVDWLSAKSIVPTETLEQWKRPNLDALTAFQERKTGGMNLSERVWQLGQQTKSELELALDIGLGEGKSAASLSRDVRKYLKEPNKLFRRVRDKHGNLRLSKAAEAYHTGQGVYRSSYKNALRLTATENNMAYRTADHDKWGNLDFVIGQEVETSNNHTLNGVPFEDICDFLKGKYPKDFKFTGWHPFCRCFVTPILADWDEQLEVMDKQMSGEDVSNYHYKGEVTEMPKSYNDWIEKNAERIEKAKSVPYFIKDNYVDGNIRLGLNWKKETTPPIQVTSTFREAKTLAEAQEIAEQYIDTKSLNKTFKGKAIFKGVDLEMANDINKALANCFDSVEIPKISGIKAISGSSATGKKLFSSTESIAAYDPVNKGIYINTDVLKSRKALEAYQKRTKEAWDYVMSRYDKLSPAQRAIVDKYKIAGRELVDGSLDGFITHEIGHHVQWQVLTAAENNAIGKEMARYASKISGYASATKGEYLAESFVAYMRGETHLLDSTYVDALNAKRKVSVIAEKVTDNRKQVLEAAKARQEARTPEEIQIIKNKARNRQILKENNEYELYLDSYKESAEWGVKRDKIQKLFESKPVRDEYGGYAIEDEISLFYEKIGDRQNDWYDSRRKISDLRLSLSPAGLGKRNYKQLLEQIDDYYDGINKATFTKTEVNNFAKSVDAKAAEIRQHRIDVNAAWDARKQTDIISRISTADEKTLIKILQEAKVAKTVQLSGMAIEQQREIATAAARMQKLYDLDPIDIRMRSFPAKNKNTLMWACGRYVEMNEKYWLKANMPTTTGEVYDNCVTTWRKRHQSIVDKYERWIKSRQELLAKLDPVNDKWDIASIEREIKKYTKELNKEKLMLESGMSRHNVFLSRETMLRDTYTHESGHVVHDQILGGINKHLRKGKYASADAAVLDSELTALYKKHKKLGGGWLSEYGYTTAQEFVAECNVLYMYAPEKLPTDVKHWFDLLVGYAKTGKLPANVELPSVKFKPVKASRKTKVSKAEVEDAKTPLTPKQRERRKEIKQEAKKMYKDEMLRNIGFSKDVKVSGKSVNEWLNQPISAELVDAKNELLLRLKTEFAKMEYITTTKDDKNRRDVIASHIFKHTLNGKTVYVIVHEYRWGECLLHSITEFANVTK